MKVGIISDTHSYFHPQIPEVFADRELILHAGDIGTLEVLEQFEAICPTKAVWGNIDGAAVRRATVEHIDETIGGVRVWMTHIGGRPGRWAKGIGPRLRKTRPDLFICGHSHILRVERIKSLGGLLFMNPGAAGRQGLHTVKTCIRLEFDDGVMKNAEAVHLDD